MNATAGHPQTTELLQAEEVAGYLASRGLLRPGVPSTVATLGGGVSNAVFAIHSPGKDLVLKQALPRLRVADLWEADPARALREGLALRTLHALTPASVPDCLDMDEDRYVIVMPRAPTGWADWKSQLLAGHADAGTAAHLGRLLATWHQATRTGVAGLLRDRTGFDQLRVDPYYRTVMARRPDLAAAVEEHLDRLLATQVCLVHGDFSPKNVMLGVDGLWVIDLEVAHYGDPAFDLAFLLSHLMLKSIRRPVDTSPYGACATAFAATYTGLTGEACPPWEHVIGNVGCLLLARVVGKSPVEYLDEMQQAVACAIGEELILKPPADVPQLWTRLDEVLRDE
jgi:aminoglycoside phosphotransferase (APT) family kinase protein